MRAPARPPRPGSPGILCITSSPPRRTVNLTKSWLRNFRRARHQAGLRGPHLLTALSQLLRTCTATKAPQGPPSPPGGSTLIVVPRPGHRRRRCPQKEEIQETRVSFALSLHNRLAAVPHHEPPTERGSRGPRGRSPEKQRRRVFGSRARGWGGAVDVRPGAHVRPPPAPPPSHAIPCRHP